PILFAVTAAMLQLELEVDCANCSEPLFVKDVEKENEIAKKVIAVAILLIGLLISFKNVISKFFIAQEKNKKHAQRTNNCENNNRNARQASRTC
ncbi:MAG: hypothetical protein QXN46_02425, partial [Candidatus Woesearchaeota archaeon]